MKDVLRKDPSLFPSLWSHSARISHDLGRMKLCFHALRNSSDNLAILSAIRPASPLLMRGDQVHVHKRPHRNVARLNGVSMTEVRSRVH